MARSIQSQDLHEVAALLEQAAILVKNRSIYGEEHTRTHKSLVKVGHAVGQLQESLRRVRRRVFIINRNERFYLENMPLPKGPYEHFFNEQLKQRSASGLEISLEGEVHGFEHAAALFADASEQRFSRFRWLSPEKVYYLENRISAGDEGGGIFDSPLFSIPELRIQEEHYLAALRQLEVFMEHCEEATPEEFASIEGVTRRLVDQLLEAPDGVVPLTTVPYYDSFTYYHSLNVCVLTLAAARRVITSAPILERIAQAALLHDVGKSRVPKEILYKPGRLNDSEAKVIRDHPVLGAAILQKLPVVDPLNVSVAFGHHIKDGGAGYPRVSPGYRLDPVTRLVEVVDIFEALTANRPYKTAMTARQAFEILYGSSDLLSFRPYIDLLYHAIGLEPVGTQVQTAGGLGVVCPTDDPETSEIRLVDASAVSLRGGA
ncbi:MAG: HD domain-containing protein [Planctomycetes bacterium]|nr:HD domain-containing protein [Planctomycetota bacterium]